MKLIDKFVVGFCVFDVLFLTYLPFVALTISTPIIVLWTVAKIKNIAKDKEYKIHLIYISLMFISILIGAIKSNELIYDNIKVLIIQVLCYQYYFMFKFYKTRYNYCVNYKKWFIFSLVLDWH
jgi:hypothetical protein